MDNSDISTQLLGQVLLQAEKCNKTVIEKVIEWVSDVQPPINLTKTKISNFLSPQRLKMSAKNFLPILKKLYENKCPRNFIRAYLAVIKDNSSSIENILDYQKIKAEWKNIPIEILQVYTTTFELKISEKEQDQRFYQLLDSKEYRNCVDFIKITGNNKQYTQELIKRMTTNKQASKAADYIKQLKLNPKDYPGIGQRLYKNSARHFLSHNGWEYCQQIFIEHPQALSMIIQDLIYKKQMNEALSIFTRHPHLQPFFQKPQSVVLLNQHKLINHQIIQNYLQKDEFHPNNSEKYLTLQQLGIIENDIIWVDNDYPQLDEVLNQIMKSKIIGIDTESIVGQTKLQKDPNESAALIQIATCEKIYIFDGFKCDSLKIKNALIKVFESQSIKVGHSLTNDTQPMLRSIKCNQKIKINNLMDIAKIFKKLHPKEKYSSLSFICKFILGKQLCKQQTLTNWRGRPIRRNQTHYAALDAFCVIKLYQQFLEKFGQIVNQYGQMDNDDF